MATHTGCPPASTCSKEGAFHLSLAGGDLQRGPPKPTLRPAWSSCRTAQHGREDKRDLQGQ